MGATCRIHKRAWHVYDDSAAGSGNQPRGRRDTLRERNPTLRGPENGKDPVDLIRQSRIGLPAGFGREIRVKNELIQHLKSAYSGCLTPRELREINYQCGRSKDPGHGHVYSNPLRKRRRRVRVIR